MCILLCLASFTSQCFLVAGPETNQTRLAYNSHYAHYILEMRYILEMCYICSLLSQIEL